MATDPISSDDYDVIDGERVLVDIVELVKGKDALGAPKYSHRVVAPDQEAIFREMGADERKERYERELQATHTFYLRNQLPNITAMNQVRYDGKIYRILSMSGRNAVGRVFTLRCILAEPN